MAKKRSTKAAQTGNDGIDVNGESSEIPKKIDVYITPEEWEIIAAAMQRENFKVKAVKGPWALAKILTWIQESQRRQKLLDEILDGVETTANLVGSMEMDIADLKILATEILLRASTSLHDREEIEEKLKRMRLLR